MLTSLLARCAGAGTTLVLVAVWALSAPVPSAQAATTRASSTPTAVLAQGVGMGDRPSMRVRRLQRVLERAGFDVGPPGIDGRFGSRTAAAVRRLQASFGLAADGAIGPKTRRLVRLIADRDRLRRERRPAAASRPKAQPVPTPPASRPAVRPRTPAATTGETMGTGSRLATVFAVIGALTAVAALSVLVLRRSSASRDAELVEIRDELYLQGRSEDERIGEFRGLAVAMKRDADTSEGAAEMRYLVEDPGKPAPVWVRERDVHRPTSRLAGEAVIGYVTVNAHGSRIGARGGMPEESEIRALCGQAGWRLVEIVRDVRTHTMPERPGLAYALERIGAGEAQGLVVADIRRLAGSLGNLGSLLEWFRDAGAALIAPDVGLNTATVDGRKSASTLIAFAEWERDHGSTSLPSVVRAGPAEPDDRGAPETRTDPAPRIEPMRPSRMSLPAVVETLKRAVRARPGRRRDTGSISRGGPTGEPADERQRPPHLPTTGHGERDA